MKIGPFGHGKVALGGRAPLPLPERHGDPTMKKNDNSQVRRAATAFALLLGLGALAACNTTEGLGKDMESAGDAVSDAARDAKD